MYTMIALSMLLLLLVAAQATGTGVVYFLESAQKEYLRPINSEGALFSQADLAASVAVLLGVDPPITMSPASAIKIDKLVTPDPFHRPGRVASLVFEDFDTAFLNDKNITQLLGIKSTQQRLLSLEKSKYAANILGGTNVRLEALNFPAQDDFDLEYLKKKIESLASLPVESSSGESGEEELLTISLPTGSSLQLDLSKRADYKLVLQLLSLSHGLDRAVASPRDSAAELFLGSISGMKAMKRENRDVSAATELVFAAFANILHTLEKATNGEMVGIVVLSESEGNELMREMVGKYQHIRTHRMLKEEKKSPLTVDKFSRRTLVACTTIILIIATLMGSWCMCYMPLTRDTLLYSGAKLD